MQAVSTSDSTGYLEYPGAMAVGAESRIRRMLLDADMGDRKAAIGIVSRIITARRFGPVQAVADVDRILECLDELELLFALELSSIEDELVPAMTDCVGAGAVVEEELQW